MVETVPVESSKPDEVFTSCSELSKHGYEGYECTNPSRCINGHIVSDVTDLRSLRSTELVASNYECPQVVRSSEYDDYYSEDYYYEQDEEKFICCRDQKFMGKGTRREIDVIITFL